MGVLQWQAQTHRQTYMDYSEKKYSEGHCQITRYRTITNKQTNIIQIGNVSTPGIGQKQPFRGLLSTYQVEDKPIQTNHTPEKQTNIHYSEGYCQHTN